MPALALNRLRLRRMTGEAAVLVVNQAPHLIDADVAEQVVRFVAADPRPLPDRDLRLNPLVSASSAGNSTTNGGKWVSRDYRRSARGSHEQVLTDLYESSVADLPVGVRRFIEDLC